MLITYDQGRSRQVPLATVQMATLSRLYRTSQAKKSDRRVMRYENQIRPIRFFFVGVLVDVSSAGLSMPFLPVSSRVPEGHVQPGVEWLLRQS